MKNYPGSKRNTLHSVPGDQVKYLNRNNSAADCSIAYKFGTEIQHATCDTQLFQGHRVKGQDHSVK